jgi:hypothetical protein
MCGLREKRGTARSRLPGHAILRVWHAYDSRTGNDPKQAGAKSSAAIGAEMKYRVWLPEQEHIIDADSGDEAQELFKQRDDIFDFVEVDEAAEPETQPGDVESEVPDWLI